MLASFAAQLFERAEIWYKCKFCLSGVPFLFPARPSPSKHISSYRVASHRIAGVNHQACCFAESYFLCPSIRSRVLPSSAGEKCSHTLCRLLHRAALGIILLPVRLLIDPSVLPSHLSAGPPVRSGDHSSIHFTDERAMVQSSAAQCGPGTHLSTVLRRNKSSRFGSGVLVIIRTMDLGLACPSLSLTSKLMRK